MILLPHRVRLIVASLLLTFLSFRAWLHLYPNTDLNVGPYNIHHLFTGILLIAICGIPLAIFQGRNRWLDIAALGFGVGLSLALDEWVFLIATDGSNASYLLRVSLWGGAIMVGSSCLYTALLWLSNRANKRRQR